MEILAVVVVVVVVGIAVVAFKKSSGSKLEVPTDTGPDLTPPVKGGGDVDLARFKKMTKVQLEATALEEFGIELDRRKTKENMLEELGSKLKGVRLNLK
jgi:hypothetical protein